MTTEQDSSAATLPCEKGGEGSPRPALTSVPVRGDIFRSYLVVTGAARVSMHEIMLEASRRGAMEDNDDHSQYWKYYVQFPGDKEPVMCNESYIRGRLEKLFEGGKE